MEWCTHSYNINYGTGRQRARETAIKNGFWADYSNLSAEEMEELEKTRKDKYRAYQKDYYEKHKDEIKEHSKTYYSTKVKGVVPYDKERRKEKYEANKEKILARQREYDRAHYVKKERQVKIEKIYQYYDGKFVREWESIQAAADYYGVTKKAITANLTGKTKYFKKGGKKCYFLRHLV